MQKQFITWFFTLFVVNPQRFLRGSPTDASKDAQFADYDFSL
jgi:hypothetical protein